MSSFAIALQIIACNYFTYSEGAAIVVKSPRISGGFVENIYNPVCFLQFDDITPPPVDWKSKDVI